MPFIEVIFVLWLKMALTHLKLNGLMHLEDEYNRRTSLNSESASLKFVINCKRPTVSLLALALMTVSLSPNLLKHAFELL